MAAVREAELRLREAIRQSKKEGREEEKKEVTKKLLRKGMDITSISEITGLSEEEIKNLK